MYRNSFRLLHSANVRVSFLTRNSLSSSIRWSTSAAQLDDDNNVESLKTVFNLLTLCFNTNRLEQTRSG